MPAIADLKPGQTVKVTVKAQPTNAAATKTLVRLLSKDVEAAKRNARIKRGRLANPTLSPRGGRWRVWEHRQPKKFVVHGKPGETGTFFAGVQELRELQSVERFVDVEAA